MMESRVPVTEDELHAYVDGELPAERRAAVEAWLAVHPEDAAQVAQWRAQADAIRARYGAIANEPVPARFDLDDLAQPRRNWRAIAAAAVARVPVVGARPAGSRTARRHRRAVDVRSAHADALTAHKLYVAEVRHPIEVGADERASAAVAVAPRRRRRCARRTSRPIRSSSWADGCCPARTEPAALFMYERPTGERYTFYCSRANTPRSALRYNTAGTPPPCYGSRATWAMWSAGPPSARS